MGTEVVNGIEMGKLTRIFEWQHDFSESEWRDGRHNTMRCDIRASWFGEVVAFDFYKIGSHCRSLEIHSEDTIASPTLLNVRFPKLCCRPQQEIKHIGMTLYPLTSGSIAVGVWVNGGFASMERTVPRPVDINFPPINPCRVDFESENANLDWLAGINPPNAVAILGWPQWKMITSNLLELPSGLMLEL